MEGIIEEKDNLPIVAVDGLIKMKAATGRDKDVRI